MKVKATIGKRGNHSARVFVEIDASVSEEYSFLNSAMKYVPNTWQPVSVEQPFVTFAAIEGAWMSGAFYARHKLNAKAFKIELLSYAFEGEVENVTPFAVATTVAIYEAIAGVRDYSEADLADGCWDVLAVERA